MAYRNFLYNTKTGLYDISEGEIIFSMPIEITWRLEKSAKPSLMDWYNTELTSGERKNIKIKPYVLKNDNPNS